MLVAWWCWVEKLAVPMFGEIREGRKLV